MTWDMKWHETCKCKCRVDANVCNNKQRWNKDKCKCECKELIDKDVCNKGFIYNPSNRECGCDKSCDVEEYLDYENCNCRRRLVDKLVEECTENIEEAKISRIILAEDENMHKNKCSFCPLHIVLFSIIFAMNIGVGTYFIYQKYMNRNKKTAPRDDYVHQAENY